MSDLSLILSEGTKYIVSGDYIISRPVEDLRRHIYTFSGDLIYLPDGRVFGSLISSLTPEKSNLILGVLNDDELQFCEIYTFGTRFFNLKLTTKRYNLSFEGKCVNVDNLDVLCDMNEDIPEIGQSYSENKSKPNYELVFGVERQRLEPYFQKKTVDISTAYGNMVSLLLKPQLLKQKH